MWSEKDLIGIKQLSKEGIEDILQLSKEMKAQLLRDKNARIRHITGNMTTLFFENSTRTKHSFAVAGESIGLSVSDLQLETSSINKGETLYDTVTTIDQMNMDIMVMRHSHGGAAHFAATKCRASLVNAGDGTCEHPTQALLDAMTMIEAKGGLKGLRVTIAGDIVNSRVAKSNILLLNKMGAHVTCTGPATLLPLSFEKIGTKVEYDLTKAVQDADVVMGLRIQLERQGIGAFPDLREYNQLFGIDGDIFSYARPDAIIMHPGPVNRGVELDRTIIDGEASWIKEQVTNGTAIRMAILYRLMETRSQKV